MEDFGEIIYFVLLVIFAVIGGLSKKKKKKPAEPGSPEPSVFPDLWPEKGRQFQTGRKIPEPHPAASVREYQQAEVSSGQSEMPRHTYSFESSMPEILSYETVDDVSKIRVKKQMKESISKKQSFFKSDESRETAEIYHNPIEIEFNDIQEVRKAFIYSEIFNRKYL